MLPQEVVKADRMKKFRKGLGEFVDKQTLKQIEIYPPVSLKIRLWVLGEYEGDRLLVVARLTCFPQGVSAAVVIRDRSCSEMIRLKDPAGPFLSSCKS